MSRTAKISITLPAIPFCMEANVVVYACLIGVVEALVKTFL